MNFHILAKKNFGPGVNKHSARGSEGGGGIQFKTGNRRRKERGRRNIDSRRDFLEVGTLSKKQRTCAKLDDVMK